MGLIAAYHYSCNYKVSYEGHPGGLMYHAIYQAMRCLILIIATHLIVLSSAAAHGKIVNSCWQFISSTVQSFTSKGTGLKGPLHEGVEGKISLYDLQILTRRGVKVTLQNEKSVTFEFEGKVEKVGIPLTVSMGSPIQKIQVMEFGKKGLFGKRNDFVVVISTQYRVVAYKNGISNDSKESMHQVFDSINHAQTSSSRIIDSRIGIHRRLYQSYGEKPFFREEPYLILLRGQSLTLVPWIGGKFDENMSNSRHLVWPTEIVSPSSFAMTSLENRDIAVLFQNGTVQSFDITTELDTIIEGREVQALTVAGHTGRDDMVFPLSISPHIQLIPWVTNKKAPPYPESRWLLIVYDKGIYLYNIRFKDYFHGLPNEKTMEIEGFLRAYKISDPNDHIVSAHTGPNQRQLFVKTYLGQQFGFEITSDAHGHYDDFIQLPGPVQAEEQ